MNSELQKRIELPKKILSPPIDRLVIGSPAQSLSENGIGSLGHRHQADPKTRGASKKAKAPDLLVCNVNFFVQKNIVWGMTLRNNIN